jgi:hypothetical protein
VAFAIVAVMPAARSLASSTAASLRQRSDPPQRRVLGELEVHVLEADAELAPAVFPP